MYKKGTYLYLYALRVETPKLINMPGVGYFSTVEVSQPV
jgi:hypothetical protein